MGQEISEPCLMRNRAVSFWYTCTRVSIGEISSSLWDCLKTWRRPIGGGPWNAGAVSSSYKQCKQSGLLGLTGAHQLLQNVLGNAEQQCPGRVHWTWPGSRPVSSLAYLCAPFRVCSGVRKVELCLSQMDLYLLGLVESMISSGYSDGIIVFIRNQGS